jgi:hypothetical protein
VVHREISETRTVYEVDWTTGAGVTGGDGGLG